MKTKLETVKTKETLFPLSAIIAAKAGLAPGQPVSMEEFRRIVLESNLKKYKQEKP
jgi:hypothetical protein